MRTREMRWVVGLLLAALALAGCADDGQTPGPDPTGAVPVETTDVPEPPTSAEPTRGPEPWPEPTRPAAMERDDIEGAIAAVEYFLALYPYVFATADLEAWEEMSHPECRFCETVRMRVTELHIDGGFGTGGEVAIDEIRALPPDDEFPHFRVGVRGTEQPSEGLSASGETLESAPGGEIFYTLGVLWDGSWIVRGLVIEEEG